jgi:proline dehydrogenase
MSFFNKMTADALPFVPKALVSKFSTRYIAGECKEDALAQAQLLKDAGYRVTYDVLGEDVGSKDEVEQAAKEYEELLSAIAQAGAEINVSVKPTQMGLDISEDFCAETMHTLCGQVAQLRGFLRFEMEDAPTTDGTLRVFAKLRQQWPEQVGCVLQAMLHRTQSDAENLLKEDKPLNVRLVKGIYVEPADIAYQSYEEVKQSYLTTLETLLKGGAFVGVATHDEHIVEGLETILEKYPQAKERYEIQMLMGVREEYRQIWKDRGHPLRVYIPYGAQWYAYVVRRLRKNPKLAGQAFKGMFGRREKL